MTIAVPPRCFELFTRKHGLVLASGSDHKSVPRAFDTLSAGVVIQSARERHEDQEPRTLDEPWRDRLGVDSKEERTLHRSGIGSAEHGLLSNRRQEKEIAEKAGLEVNRGTTLSARPAHTTIRRPFPEPLPNPTESYTHQGPPASGPPRDGGDDSTKNRLTTKENSFSTLPFGPARLRS